MASGEDDQHWHVDRRIPLAVVVTLLGASIGQTGTAAWFISKLDARVQVLEDKQTATAPMPERITRLEEKVVAVQSGIGDIKALLQQGALKAGR